MDNPWATASEHPEHCPHDQEADIGLPSWSADNTTRWPEPTPADGVLWGSSVHDTHAWAPSTYDRIILSRATTPEQDIALQDEEAGPTASASSSPEPQSVPEIRLPVNHEGAPSTPPLHDSCDAGPLARLASSSRASEPEDDEPDAWAESTLLSAPDDEWGAAWTTVPSSESKEELEQPPDEWETARQEKEKLNRAVPPESLASMLRHCQQVSDEIWPALEIPETNGGESWQTGFDGLETIAKLLDQLIADDFTLPPPVQFSATATAKAMNEALKLTRHMPMSGSSPLSLLLASKGSLDWERSIKGKQDIVPDATPIGWRVLEKDDHLEPTEQKKASAGLLSFWNRRAPSIPATVTAAETIRERSRSPVRSSIDNVKSGAASQPPRAASPLKPPSSATAAPLPLSVAPEVTIAPSAVSRFLNRFSRAKSSNVQHSTLALSSHDLEFLSDIVPSACDPDDDEHVDEGDLKALSSMIKSSPLPPKLPPPLAPPPKSPMPSSRPSSITGLGTLDGKSIGGTGASPRASPGPRLSSSPNVPVLPPPLSPMPAAPFLRSQSPAVPPKDVKPLPNVSVLAAPMGAATASTSARLQSSSQPNSRSHSPFTLPLSPKVPTSLSIPPLLPPQLSPPQTPRPSGGPFTAITPSSASTMWPDSTSSFHDSNESDDEFSAFEAFSSQAAPLPFSNPIPPQRSPSPPAHRSYKPTHYPSSSSASSVLSPASQNSGNLLRSARSSHSASFDDFDDFVSPPTDTSAIRTPSPPPLPVKPQHQHQRQHPHPINTFTSQSPLTYHTHTPSHSQTFASPTVRTGLINNSYSSSSVSHSDHQRTQSLVNHAAARGGLWPNSPESPEEPRVTPILPPPWPLASPAPLTGEVDLFGNVEVFGSGSGMKTPPPPPGPASIAGLGITMASSASSPVVSPIRAPPGDLGTGAGTGMGTMRQLSPSLPPLPSTSTPLLSFSSLGTPSPVPLAKLGSTAKPMKPTQTGGLSAQDLSFFEGL